MEFENRFLVYLPVGSAVAYRKAGNGDPPKVPTGSGAPTPS